MDRVDKATRSRIMSRIRSKGNLSTERRLRMLMVRAGIAGWKALPRNLPGNPDFVFPHIPLAIFVDGCFWHGCPRCYHRPLSNRQYWDAKVLRNEARDRRVRANLRRGGWSVLRIWEHGLNTPAEVVSRINAVLRKKGCQR
jgi:DNA mismatch endonuclease (patch repair protein)